MGWRMSEPEAMEEMTSRIFSAYGRAATAASWARFSLAAATSSIALVICFMLCMLRIFRLMARNPLANSTHHLGRIRPRSGRNGERLLEFLDGLVERLFVFRRQILGVADGGENLRPVRVHP